MAMQLRPNVDVDRGEIVHSRRKLLEKAAGEKRLLHAFHFPFPGLGHVTRGKETWQWHPLNQAE